jgi:hypothetical protein
MRTITFFKKVAVALVIAAAASCESVDDRREADGRKASAAFCECLEEKTKDECLDDLKSENTGYMTDAFIDAFNEANTCDITLYIEEKE